MAVNELEAFLSTWDREAQSTARLLRALPSTKYDFRPDAGGRSLGELAWHLAEVEAYLADGIQRRKVDFAAVEGLSRPREIAALAPGYRRIHEQALARIRTLELEDLDQVIPFANRQLPIRPILWSGLLHHLIHHRGQLTLMNRIAGGTSPGVFGPNREEMAAMRAEMQARS